MTAFFDFCREIIERLSRDSIVVSKIAKMQSFLSHLAQMTAFFDFLSRDYQEIR